MANYGPKSLITRELTIVRLEMKAVLFNDDDGESHWLPLSEIEYDSFADEGELVEVTMPLWLAEREGLA